MAAGDKVDKTTFTNQLKWTPADTPYKDISWSSDNQDVATVTGDSVTAVALGNANLTLTSRSSSNLNVTINLTVQ